MKSPTLATREIFEGPDGRLSYLRRGEGSPLVLLHSLALGAAMWEGVVREFTPAHEVIALDLRGHGQSGWSGADFSVADLADDVLALVDHLDLKEANVLGLSMGGSVALTLAGRAPGRVTRLVLCDTTAWYGENAPAAWRERATQAASRPRYLQIAFQVERWFTDAFARHHPEVIAKVTGLFLATAPAAHAAACRALGAMDSRELLAVINCPTLVVTGRDDLATPPAMGESIAAAVAGATMLLAPGKHFAILESEGLRGAIRSHLAGETLGAIDDATLLDPCCRGQGDLKQVVA